MKLIDFAFRCIATVGAVVAVACVDQSFDLKDVSTEVTIGQGTTQLYVGTLEQKSIKELLGEEKIDGLGKDEEGNFIFSYSGEGKPIVIDGIENSYPVAGLENRFVVEYPTFDFDMTGIVIDEHENVNFNDDELGEMLPSNSGTITEDVASMLPRLQGTFDRTFSSKDLHLLADVPEQIENIHRITFRDIESGHTGAPMRLTVDFKGLAGINGGGVVDFEIELKGGIFRLVNEQNELVVEGNSYQQSYDVESGAESVEFVIYVESVENTTHLNNDHQLDIPLELSCKMSFDLEAKGGEFNIIDAPEFAIYANFEYGDAEILLNDDIALVEYNPEVPQQVKIKGLPTEIKSINSLELMEGTMLNFYVNGFDWLGDNAEKVAVEVTVPSYLVLDVASGSGDYEYDAESGVLTTTLADIADGVEMGIERIDFGGEGIAPDANGEIILDLDFNINVHFVEGASVKVSSLAYEGDLEVTAGVRDMDVVVKSVSGKVDYSYVIDQEVDISSEDMELGDLEIGGVGLSPIIRLNIVNPFTIPLVANGELRDDTNRELRLENIPIKAAEYVGGEIVPTRSCIVVATEERRGEFADKDVYFIAVDFDEFLKGVIPSKLSANLSVDVDSESVNTLYLAEQFEIFYDFSVEVPIAFNDKLDIRYEDEFTGFNSVFTDIYESVEEFGFKFGDVTFVAYVKNTTPLAFEVEAEVINTSGEKVSVPISFVEGYDRIAGSTDGKSVVESTVRLNLGDGELFGLEQLAEIDGIRIRLNALCDAEERTYLNENQWIEAKVMLELNGGITVDIKDTLEE